MDLAREHGISTQAVRNYERDGVLPAAARTSSGYRTYTDLHAAALRAYLALVPAYGYGVAAEIMRAATRGEVDAALRAVDHGHVQLLSDRETLDAVETTIGVLTTAPPRDRPDRPLTVGALAHRLAVTPATLRKWERAGVLTPARDRVSRQRLYGPDDVRDAELAHLLRRGGYLLDHIATVMAQVRAAQGPGPLAESLDAWRQRLAARGRAMLTAGGHLAAYLTATGR
ncbi:TioE family transcriptional regulator [Micromonospora krabiensis]|uniref:DNA-binding transcriptional regulator, MerR family n=1 Tax=Micromonospora krabiensis TaxID=307121 RepID=A0A1C3N555_9ACTN|nr:TioE family transcriptional regulator [Micromonospora krabiensis]SBV27707.1 DNA-binding transcriptional regulator, MerR family [Micromonospora krabiensis]